MKIEGFRFSNEEPQGLGYNESPQIPQSPLLRLQTFLPTGSGSGQAQKAWVQTENVSKEDLKVTVLLHTSY